MSTYSKIFGTLSVLAFPFMVSCRPHSDELSADAAEPHKNWTKIASKEFELLPPPKEGSKAYKEDFSTLHDLQDKRSKEDCKLAGSQRDATFEAFYGDVDWISEKELEDVTPLLTKVMKFSDRVADYHKDEYKRPRPYDTDTELKPCVAKPGGNKAYPSSHATAAASSGCVLSKIFPDRADKIEAYSSHLGDLRAIVGVHHPSDVKAGQKLGADICKRLLTEKTFKKELEPLLPE